MLYLLYIYLFYIPDDGRSEIFCHDPLTGRYYEKPSDIWRRIPATDAFQGRLMRGKRPIHVSAQISSGIVYSSLARFTFIGNIMEVIDLDETIDNPPMPDECFVYVVGAGFYGYSFGH